MKTFYYSEHYDTQQPFCQGKGLLGKSWLTKGSSIQWLMRTHLFLLPAFPLLDQQGKNLSSLYLLLVVCILIHRIRLKRPGRREVWGGKKTFQGGIKPQGFVLKIKPTLVSLGQRDVSIHLITHEGELRKQSVKMKLFIKSLTTLLMENAWTWLGRTKKSFHPMEAVTSNI